MTLWYMHKRLEHGLDWGPRYMHEPRMHRVQCSIAEARRGICCSLERVASVFLNAGCASTLSQSTVPMKALAFPSILSLVMASSTHAPCCDSSPGFETSGVMLATNVSQVLSQHCLSCFAIV